MIINNLDNSSIKIIIDEEDLKNNEINLKEWISNPQKTNFFLKKLLFYFLLFFYYKNFVL